MAFPLGSEVQYCIVHIDVGQPTALHPRNVEASEKGECISMELTAFRMAYRDHIRQARPSKRTRPVPRLNVFHGSNSLGMDVKSAMRFRWRAALPPYGIDSLKAAMSFATGNIPTGYHMQSLQDRISSRQIGKFFNSYTQGHLGTKTV